VLDGWISFRRQNPAGKRTSELDDIVTTTWEPEWSTELLQVLSVLERLVALEPKQASILEEVVAGPTFTRDELAALNVRWPTTAADRRPRGAIDLEIDA